MRVTGGTISRREIRVPRDIRPTQDKVRAAIFNSLGSFVVGVRVLDLFAGSGAFGIEAWSRGAAFVCWVESDRRVLPALKENVSALCRDGAPAQIRQADALRFLEKDVSGEPFNLILADPPYDRDGSRRWLEKMLPLLEGHSILAADGVLVFEQDASEPVLQRDSWLLLRDGRYGGTRVLIYRRTAGGTGEQNT